MVFFHDNKMYETVSVFDLYVGMHLYDGLYSLEHNKMRKLCQDVTITDDLKKTLRKFADKNMQFYVNIDEYQKIMDQVNANVPKVVQENYIEIKNETASIYENIQSEGVISEEAATTVSNEVRFRVDTAPVSELLHCINVIRSVDDYLYTHSTNVSVLNGLLGKWMKLSDDEINELIRVGLLHDIGKAKIPVEILDKPAKLTNEEFEIIKTHPVHSYNILKESGETRQNILLGVKHHHERTNATGYPDKLTSEKIPLYSRITTISDIYDAMVAKRSYKPSHSPFAVLDNFAQGKYLDLDFSIVDSFLTYMPMELVGRNIILSSGEIAEVVHVNTGNILYPIVKTENKMIPTNEEVYCVAMYDPVFTDNR